MQHYILNLTSDCLSHVQICIIHQPLKVFIIHTVNVQMQLNEHNILVAIAPLNVTIVNMEWMRCHKSMLFVQ